MRDANLGLDAVRAVQPGEEEAGAVTVKRRADDDRTPDPPRDEQRNRAGRVLGGDGRGRLDHELDLRAAQESRICSASVGPPVRDQPLNTTTSTGLRSAIRPPRAPARDMWR
jgi:hypothetical protein